MDDSLRLATLALQAQDRLVSAAARSLVDDGDSASLDELSARALVEVVFRALVARLSGAQVHPGTIERLRGSFAPSVLRDAAEAAARAIREGVGRRADDARELDRALRSLLALIAPGAESAPPPRREGPPPGSPDPFAEARPTLVFALQDLSDDSLPGEAPPRAVAAVLRLRARTARAAHELSLAARRALDAFDVVPLPSAPDELFMGASGALTDAVLRLVRAAATLTGALPDGVRGQIAGSVVALSSDEAPPEALLSATVLAGRLARREGLLQLDERALAAGGSSLAEVPGASRHVDPAAPFRHDRWELSALLQRPPLLGRDDDIAALARAIAGRDDQRARLAALHGPPGIGKTSLVRAAFQETGYGEADAPVLWGAADPLQPTPYAAIVGMVRALAGAAAGDVRARARLERLLSRLAEHLENEDGRELVSLSGVLAYLIGAIDEDDELELEAEVEGLSPRALRVAIRRALLLLVEALEARAGGQPAVVVVTGAEAIDTPTQELLAFLARRLGPRLVVLLVSSTRLRLPRAFEDEFAAVRHELRPLDPEAARSVISTLLGEPTELEGVSPLIERARGSPLALMHLVRFSVEGGLLRQHEGRWDFSELKARLLPGRLERVLEGRVHRLPDTARRVLGFCGALGHAFMPSAVEFVGVRLGLSRDEITQALALLLQTGFLQRSLPRPAAPVFPDEQQRPEEALLVFEHPLLRAAAEGALDEVERSSAHEVVAEALEELLPSGARAIAPMLARHHRLGGNRAAAVQHLKVAVRRAVRLDDRPGAITMAKEGLSVASHDDVETRFHFQLELEKVLELAGDREAHKEALKQLVRTAERTGEPRRQGQALHRVARFNVFGGDPDKAEQAALRALERFRFGDDRRSQAQTLRVMALARFERRDLEGAIDALTAARGLTGEGDRRALGLIEHQLGMIRLEADDAVGALEHLLLAREHKRGTGDLAGEGACLDAVADVYARTGRLHVAMDILARAVALRERIGDEAGRAQSLKNLADVALRVGDAGQAAELASSARALARALGLERLEHSATVVAARAALDADDPQAAEQLLDGMRRRVDAKTDPFAAMEAALFSAWAKWSRARSSTTPQAKDRLLKTALKRAREATRLGEGHGYASGQVLGMAVTGQVLNALGDPGGALLYAQRAAELFDERASTGLPVEKVLGAHASVLAALGDTDEARSVLERAVAELMRRASRLPEDLRGRFWSVPLRAELKQDFDRLRRDAA